MRRLLAVGAAILLAASPALSQDTPAGVVKTDDLGSLPDFSLTDASGKTVTRSDLLGKPLIVSFTFSNCGGPCPRIMNRMEELQKKLGDKGVRFVTVTVDPERDKPDVLSKWSKEFHANPEQWVFLGGEPKAVKTFVMGSFKVAIEGSGDALTHGLNLALVDRDGKIKGFYAPGEKALVEEAARLVAPPPEPPSLARKLELALNAATALLVLVGWVAVKTKRVALHRPVMLLAFVTWCSFLGVYGWSWAQHGHVAFAGPGAEGYKVALVAYVVVALAAVPLVLVSSALGVGGAIDRHRKVARVTMPLFLLVALAGAGLAGFLLLRSGA